MSDSYQDWLFRPVERRTQEDTQRWLESCHVEGPVDRQLQDVPHWTIITGPPRSGKSVALDVWARRQAARALVIPYPPDQWPGGAHAWVRRQHGHLPQLLAVAALAIRARLQDDPALAAALRPTQREFFRWLMEYLHKPRTYRVFADNLPTPELQEIYGHTPVMESGEEEYDDPQTIYWLMDELVSLARAMNYERVIYTIDLPGASPPDAGDPLGDLFGWPDAAKHPGLAVIVALGRDCLAHAHLVERARGGVSQIESLWSVEECRRVANSHLRAGSQLAGVVVEQFADPSLLSALDERINEEFGGPSPGGWAGLAHTLLHLTRPGPEGAIRPLEAADAPLVLAHFYAHTMKLRLDTDNLSVWRGPRRFKLDEQPFAFLRLLHQRQGQPINFDHPALRDVAGSSWNVHTLATRVRNVIEPRPLFEPDPLSDPPPREPIYVLNKRSQGGYWLENYL